MEDDAKIRNKIIRQVYRIPIDKLKELDDFVSKLEINKNKNHKNLSFAGCWSDIDNSMFDDFTKNLIENRCRNRERIYEKSID